MLDLRTMILAAVAAFLVGAGAAWWITADYKEAKYTSAISKMQIDAANALTEATRRATEQERENNRLATELEVAHNEYKSKLDEVYADNLRITSELGGLYDSRAAADNCPMPAAPSASANPIKPPAGAKLSDSLTQLLLTESRRADEAAAYAQTCYEWVKKLGAK
jgi:hypothetical protein